MSFKVGIDKGSNKMNGMEDKHKDKDTLDMH
jgi:hypothetical protein